LLLLLLLLLLEFTRVTHTGWLVYTVLVGLGCYTHTHTHVYGLRLVYVWLGLRAFWIHTFGYGCPLVVVVRLFTVVVGLFYPYTPFYLRLFYIYLVYTFFTLPRWLVCVTHPHILFGYVYIWVGCTFTVVTHGSLVVHLFTVGWLFGYVIWLYLVVGWVHIHTHTPVVVVYTHTHIRLLVG